MEKKAFKAESQRLLDLMIHSIYTHKEIFLREDHLQRLRRHRQAVLSVPDRRERGAQAGGFRHHPVR